jgi:hypothetical protein
MKEFEDVEDVEDADDEHDDVEEDGEVEHERDISRNPLSPLSPETGRSLPVV